MRIRRGKKTVIIYNMMLLKEGRAERVMRVGSGASIERDQRGMRRRRKTSRGAGQVGWALDFLF